MPFSHRDLRAHREVGRLVGLVAAALLGLIGVAVLSPNPILGLLAVASLGALGAYALASGNALVNEYARDLGGAHPGGPDPLGAVGAEVHSRVPLDRDSRSPMQRSPHARSPARRSVGTMGS